MMPSKYPATMVHSHPHDISNHKHQTSKRRHLKVCTIILLGTTQNIISNPEKALTARDCTSKPQPLVTSMRLYSLYLFSHRTKFVVSNRGVRKNEINSSNSNEQNKKNSQTSQYLTGLPWERNGSLKFYDKTRTIASSYTEIEFMLGVNAGKVQTRIYCVLCSLFQRN